MYINKLSSMSERIRACIIGVGNCCTSLITGIVSYAKHKNLTGITYENIGGYLPDSVDFVLGFDVDKRKVGKKINEAILQKPNCTPLLCSEEELNNSSIEFGMVHKGPVMDGVAPHMSKYDDDETFVVDSEQTECTRDEIIQLLKDNKVDVIVNYLPVGSQEAVEFWAQICIDTKTPMMNCMPIFIASDPVWAQKFVDAGVAICGDDMRSQAGSSILSARLQSMLLERGMKIKFHSQVNQGGNTDFLNMTDKNRLVSKKISKENVIRNEHKIANVDIDDTFIYAGPSDYIRYYKDTKVAYIRIEAEGFGGFPMVLDCRLSVVDSANSAGVVVDSVRFLQVAKRLGKSGPIFGPSAFYQKTPPKPLPFDEAKDECDAMAAVRFE
jgi:myo-inositol-1-phosphate synthase